MKADQLIAVKRILTIFFSILLNLIINVLIYVGFHIWYNFYLHLKGAWRMYLFALSPKLRAYLPYYDMSGLKHHPDYLASIKNQIPFWETKTQSDFCDLSTRNEVNKSINIIIAVEEIEKIDKNTITPTGIGNLAYISLHAKNEKARSDAKYILEQIKEHYQILTGK